MPSRTGDAAVDERAGEVAIDAVEGDARMRLCIVAQVALAGVEPPTTLMAAKGPNT